MPRCYVLSDDALADLRGISRWIERDSPVAAHRMLQRIHTTCDNLGRHPGIGHARSDLTSRPVLFFVAGAYLVIYDPAPSPIAVLRVLHGARDVGQLL